MSESAVAIQPPTQETVEPVKNLTEKLDWFFLAVKNITHPSKFRALDHRIERPLFQRQQRATALKEFLSIPKDNREGRIQVLTEAHLRDELTRQYLNQGEVSVAFPIMGTQKARYATIIPPESLQNELSERPSIILIPGISNDLDCVGALMQEAAFEGRRITAIAYPESFMGTVTEEFAQAVEESPDYTPHVVFFKQAISNLTKPGETVELWGYSTGAPIVEQILNDPKFQQRTTDAVLLCPASSVDQSAASLNLGILHEIGLLKKHFPLLSRFSLTAGSKQPREQQHDVLRKSVMEALIGKVRKRFDFWKTSKVKIGGKIIVVSAAHDAMTKSAQAVDQFSQNPQVRVINLPDGFHATPGINSALVLPQIFQKQSIW